MRFFCFFLFTKRRFFLPLGFSVALRQRECPGRAAHPVVAAVIPRPRSAREAIENAMLMEVELAGALWSELRRAGLLPDEAPSPAA